MKKLLKWPKFYKKYNVLTTEEDFPIIGVVFIRIEYFSDDEIYFLEMENLEYNNVLFDEFEASTLEEAQMIAEREIRYALCDKYKEVHRWFKKNGIKFPK